MKKILVMGDTHGHKANIARALLQFGDVDFLIHLGDYYRDAAFIHTLTQKQVYAVKGNCDIAAEAKTQIVITSDNVRILALHGHRQNVKMSLLGLGLYAQQEEADIVLYGHTHRTDEQFFEGIMLYNPGSLGEPRGTARPTVGLLTTDAGAFWIETKTL